MVRNPNYHPRLTRRGENLKTAAIATGGVALLAAGLGYMIHHADVSDKQTTAIIQEQNTMHIIDVNPSQQTREVKAKANDTVGSLVLANSAVVSTDLNKVPKYVAFDAAVKKVESLPENKDALSDGILQIGEDITVPVEMTVSEVDVVQSDN